MRRRSYEISYFKCPECSNSIPLPRMKNARRSKGHIKDLFCPYCNDVVKTKEIRPIDFI